MRCLLLSLLASLGGCFFFFPNCGDGFLDVGEECDDGNGVGGDGCEIDCQQSCGNARLEDQLGEECDDGNELSGDGCDASCVDERCGDSLLNDAGREECDDENTNPGDGCSDLCRIEFAPLASCGNAVLDVEEVCDDGNAQGGDGCRADCRGLELCGDSLIDDGEDCDDGDAAIDQTNDGCIACVLTIQP